MAAFLDGKLAPGEVAEVAAHLRECADCRTVTGEAARFEIEEEQLARDLAAAAAVNAPAAAKPAAFSRWRAWAAAAAVAIAGPAALLLMRPPAPMTILVDAAPRDHRRVEARLSRFAWAPLQGGQRGAASSPSELEQKSAAYDVLRRTTDDEAVEARHAAGVAHLLIDQTALSVDTLASAAGDSKDAQIWNDLAAARFTVAVGEGEEAELSRALAAADRAIQLDPELPDAYFNRALILEEMNLRDQAREAWQKYLELDSSSPWSTEARQHLKKLDDRASSKPDFRKELARAAGNRDAIADLVRRFPQESRTSGEGQWLGEWAVAYLANDAARAEKTWQLIRGIGEELAAAKGERLLLHTVERMRDRDAFARGFLLYVEGRKAFGKRDYAPAEERLRRAEATFRAIGSPFAGVAEYHVLQCVSNRYRTAEANVALHALRARIDPSHRAFAAEIDWILARNANSAADWAAAAALASRARTLFTELGETQNAATNAGIEAVALERMGELEKAWELRVQAIEGNPELSAAILEPAVLWLAASDDISAARSLVDLALRAKGDAAMQARSLTLHARLAERAGDLDAAHRSLGEARRALRDVVNPEYRTALQAGVDIADAVLKRAADPQACITALDASIDFFARHGQNLYLPDAYLQRARSYRALDRNDAAVADYAASLRAIDEQPKSISSIGFLDVAEQAIDEKIELHLDRGQVREAFDTADRAHAMAGSDYRLAGVPDGTLLLEYMVLPRSVAIFSVTRDSLTVTRVPVDRTQLAARVKSFTRDIRALADVKASSAALHALLIAPVAQQIAGASELVIVPDRQLTLVPFSALHDGTRYLLETHPIRIAPSAAADRRAPASSQGAPSAIVIANPANDRVASLPWSREEAEGVAGIYGAAILESKDATRARVSEAIASSRIVHYAGHADSNAGAYGALLLASGADDPGLLSATDIARLDLRARPLVTLAACGTLRGDATHIAGTPSIARAFLDAGARAVAGTLWEIDDDVSLELFLRFHERFRAGEVPARALRAAQTAMLQTSDPRLSHPSSWAAVEVLSHL